jgi:hypothetical protein
MVARRALDARFADWSRRIDAGTPLVTRMRWVLASRLQHSVDVVTFEELAVKSETELLAVNGIGPRRVAAIQQAMATHGFSLRTDLGAVS